MGCLRNLFKLVKNSLSEWKVLYHSEVSTMVHEYNVGCPQGSNFGPFFRNLVANSLLELDLRRLIKLIVYADHFILLIEAPNAYQYGRKAEQALARIARWAESHRLTFFAEKTTSICFRNIRQMDQMRNPSTPPRTRFLGSYVKPVQSSKYLGVVVDEKLNGMAHVACI